MAVSCIICSYRFRRPVRKLLDTPSYSPGRENSEAGENGILIRTTKENQMKKVKSRRVFKKGNCRGRSSQEEISHLSLDHSFLSVLLGGSNLHMMFHQILFLAAAVGQNALRSRAKYYNNEVWYAAIIIGRFMIAWHRIITTATEGIPRASTTLHVLPVIGCGPESLSGRAVPTRKHII
jgi:hypothetical protein